MKKTIFLRVFLGYAMVLLLLALGVTLIAPPLMREHHVVEQAAGLEHLGLLLEDRVTPYLAGSASGDLGALVAAAARKTATRITVIGLDGSVLADSERGSRDMENHLHRPEIQAALQGRDQMSIRRSSTLNTEMMYMSVPLRADGRVVGALRLSLYMRDFEALMRTLRADLLKVVTAVTLIALILAFLFARSVSRPVRELIEASARVSAGDFEGRVSERRSGELGELARAHNAMTAELREFAAEKRLLEEEVQRLVASVDEGLCILDADSRVLVANAAFRHVAGNDAPVGRYIWEVVRSSGLREIVRKVSESGRAASGEAVIGGRTYTAGASCLETCRRLIVRLKEVGV